MNKKDKPEEGKQYLLIGGADKPSIANGNGWEESELNPLAIHELDEHDLRVAQAEWEAEMQLENDLYMIYDDPDYWG